MTAAGARASLLGDAVVFETSQRKLRYGELAAVDDTGRRLAARFEVPHQERLRIVVDDSNAAYPVVIDPLLTETADRLSCFSGGRRASRPAIPRRLRRSSTRVLPLPAPAT
jgi:hypothetical protein